MKNTALLALFLICVLLFIVILPRAPLEPLIKSLDFGSDDAELLMKFAAAEYLNGSVRIKALAMLVVLNRAWHPDFPDSIEEVIEQGDFQSVKDGTYYTAIPDRECEIAIENIYQGWNESYNALYLPKL